MLRNSSPKNNLDYAHTDKVMAFDVVGHAEHHANNSIPASLEPEQPTSWR